MPLIATRQRPVSQPPASDRSIKGNGQTLPMENIFARLVNAGRYLATGKTGFFDPGQPMTAMAPEAEGRQFDLPVNYNPIIMTKLEGLSFQDLRMLADTCDIIRILIENRKDTICGYKWTIQQRDIKKTGRTTRQSPDAQKLQDFFAYPDVDHSWAEWLRMLLEDLLAIDAPVLYIQRKRGGDLHALRPIDGGTIKRIIDPRGWTPTAPDAAYQQILKGVPAVNYTTEEIIYAARNIRSHRIYALGRVEQVLVSTKLWLYRQASNLEYYDKGSVPDGFIEGGENWTAVQLKEYQDLLNVALSGDLAERRKLKVVPSKSKYTASKEPALKNDYDEVLIRIACFCFGTSPTPFIKQMNRATAQSAKESANEEGVQADLMWVKALMDRIIGRLLGFNNLEFVWQDRDAQDPLERAQVDQIYLEQGVLKRNEVRVDLGRDPLSQDELTVQTAEQVIGEDTTATTATASKPLQTPPQGVTATTDADTGQQKSHAHLTLVKATPRIFPPPQEEQRAKLAQVFKATLPEVRDSVIKQLKATLSTEKMAKASMDRDDAASNSSSSFDVGAWSASVNLDAFSLAWDDTQNALIATAGDGAKDTVAKVILDEPPSDDMFGKANERAIDWAHQHAAELLGKDGSGGELAETTRTMIQRTLSQGLQQGLTPDELAAQLMEDHAFSDTRAELIAETEIANANAHGQLAGYTAVGLKSKRWLLSNDEGVCPICEGNADAGWIPIGKKFPGGADAPLQHPNCRCAIVARAQNADE